MKSKIYKESNPKKSMNKRGEVILVVAVVSFIVMASSIVAGSYFLTKDNFQASLSLGDGFVGDAEAKIFYNLECIKYVPEPNRIFFQTRSQAENLDFGFRGKCP